MFKPCWKIGGNEMQILCLAKVLTLLFDNTIDMELLKDIDNV